MMQDPLMPSQLLNQRYRLLSQVGTGGFGAVYKAVDTHFGDRSVAIKEISLHGLKPQEAIEATDTFNREVSLLSGLDHPNLPHIYDHFTDPKHWYLVMEFIEGETLEELLQKNAEAPLAPTQASAPTSPFTLEEILDMGMQLCTVLDYLHTRKPAIIFRDLKPANIMRTSTGHFYLIDFGIARRFTPGQAKDTMPFGSPGYAAPEQYGKTQTTPRADVYSLGATLHYLLSGHDPSETPFRFMSLRLQNQRIPAALETLILQMLEVNEHKRPASMVIVKRELQRIAFAELKIPRTPIFPADVPLAASQPLPSTASRSSIMSRVIIALFVLIVVGGISFQAIAALHPHNIYTGPPVINSASPSQQVERLPLVGSATLDTALAADSNSLNVVDMLFTGLVELDDQFRVQPQLAASFDESPDGLSWTFHLRPGLKFSDGFPLTAADVAYSIDRALQPATHSPTSLVYLGLIKDANKLNTGKIRTIIGDSILTPDEDTVILIMSERAAYFLSALASSCSYVVERQLIEKYGNQQFIDHLSEGGGDGPFKIAQYTPGQRIDLVPNPNYYGPKPRLEKVIFSFYRNEEASYQAYRAGEVDMTAVPPTDFQAAMQTVGFHRFPELLTYYYTMNYLVKPFDNIHIRQAFALAINKDLLAHAVWRGSVIPTNHIVPLGMPSYNPSLTGPDGVQNTSGDPLKAKTLMQQGLQEEGWSSVTQLPPITLSYTDDSATFRIEVSVLMQMWQNVLGVPVKAHLVSVNILLDNAHHARCPQLCDAAWLADYPDPQDWTSLQFCQGAPYNTMNYGQNNSPDAAQQQAVQQLLAAADVNPDPNVRMQAYQSAEQQLVNDVAWIPMYQAERSFLLRSDMQGEVFNPLFVVPPNDWANIYIGEPASG